MLTKKHFQALAKALAETMPREPPQGEDPLLNSVSGECYRAQMTTWYATRNSIVALCAESNPNFDRSRFLAACEKEN